MPDSAALDRVGFPYDPDRLPKLHRARGCKKCGGIGYKGRMGVHEVLTMSEDLERLTVERASADRLSAQAIKEGMLTLRDDGFAKVKLGQTSIEEILRVVV
jgi:type IV pilus assembly protein PilB